MTAVEIRTALHAGTGTWVTDLAATTSVSRDQLVSTISAARIANPPTGRTAPTGARAAVGAASIADTVHAPKPVDAAAQGSTSTCG